MNTLLTSTMLAQVDPDQKTRAQLDPGLRGAQLDPNQKMYAQIDPSEKMYAQIDPGIRVQLDPGVKPRA
jgi:hypothetical protein